MQHRSFYNLHLPDEVRRFHLPPGSIRRWDTHALVYDVQVAPGAVLRHYSFPDRWFEVSCSLDLAGRFVTEPGPLDWCFNCDIATPTAYTGPSAWNVDLCLDLLVAPDGRSHRLIDEADFTRAVAAGHLTGAEAAGARQGLAQLQAILETTGLVTFLNAIFPFGPVADAPSQPVMERLTLADLPWLAATRQGSPPLLVPPTPFSRLANPDTRTGPVEADEWFWSLPQPYVGGPLHLPTLRGQMRRELSRGRFQPITLGEIGAIARAELQVPSDHLLTATTAEWPVYYLALVWAWRRYRGRHGPTLRAICHSLALFLMEAAANGYGGETTPAHRAALQLIRHWPGPTDTPEATQAILQQVLAHYDLEHA